MDDKPKKRKRKAKAMTVTHNDEQLEGAMLDALTKLKGYCPQGVIILNSTSDKWKVLAFGGGNSKENFHTVLGAALAAGVVALESGPEDATEWDA
jgi:hypothetical protein